MFRVKVSRKDSISLHEQVAAEIRRAIADGEAKPGERLPPARDLAAVIGLTRAKELVRFARRHGYEPSEVAQMIEDIG
jgi:DNA-binding FadR family transcriptional regulator